jgi:hypothetical protein
LHAFEGWAVATVLKDLQTGHRAQCLCKIFTSGVADVVVLKIQVLQRDAHIANLDGIR